MAQFRPPARLQPRPVQFQQAFPQNRPLFTKLPQQEGAIESVGNILGAVGDIPGTIKKARRDAEIDKLTDIVLTEPAEIPNPEALITPARPTPFDVTEPGVSLEAPPTPTIRNPVVEEAKQRLSFLSALGGRELRETPAQAGERAGLVTTGKVEAKAPAEEKKEAAALERVTTVTKSKEEIAEEERKVKRERIVSTAKTAGKKIEATIAIAQKNLEATKTAAATKATARESEFTRRLAATAEGNRLKAEANFLEFNSNLDQRRIQQDSLDLDRGIRRDAAAERNLQNLIKQQDKQQEEILTVKQAIEAGVLDVEDAPTFLQGLVDRYNGVGQKILDAGGITSVLEIEQISEGNWFLRFVTPEATGIGEVSIEFNLTPGVPAGAPLQEFEGGPSQVPEAASTAPSAQRQKELQDILSGKK